MRGGATVPPDIHGNTIPKDAPFGKFHWVEMSYGKQAGLLGRTSLSSVLNKRRSSFSCGSTCEYNFTRHAFYDLQLDTFIVAGGSQSSQLTELDSMLNGQDYTYPVGYEDYSVWADNSSIVSVGGSLSNGSKVVLSGGAVGTTGIHNYLYDTEYSYDPEQESCYPTPNNVSQDNTVTVYNCPTTVTLAHTFNRNLPSTRFPSSRTGIGILTQMEVSPLVAEYTGAQIYELLTPVSNNCPSNIKSRTDFSSYVGTFTVGQDIMFEGAPFSATPNTFYDMHVTYSDADILSYTNGASCTATATQVYSCNEKVIGTFTLTDTYNHGVLSGRTVTNVATTKR